MRRTTLSRANPRLSKTLLGTGFAVGAATWIEQPATLGAAQRQGEEPAEPTKQDDAHTLRRNLRELGGETAILVIETGAVRALSKVGAQHKGR